MSGVPTALSKLSDLITKGTTPTTLGYSFTDDGIPFLRVQNIVGGHVVHDRDTLFIDEKTNEALRRSKIIPGDILVSIAGTIGRTGIVPGSASPMNCNQAVAIVRTNGEVFRPYLRYWLEGPEAQRQMRGSSVTGTISNLSLKQLGSLTLSLPPLPEQKRIAAILDKADELRAKRRAALAELDTLVQSIFLEMFGDPAKNPKGWHCKGVGAVAAKFSDGPFGSNLKSSHYTETGVRIIRLQNIGVGEFVDDDKAYISEQHFHELRKHECCPGDVLVGTLGDPNLRACIQPEWLPVALNKADCVQFRPDQRVTNAAYICALLNQPATEHIAQSLMLGQTRVRISMGRLRGLKIPVPPLSLQRTFAARAAAVEKLKATHRASLTHLDALFASLQHRAFRGEL